MIAGIIVGMHPVAVNQTTVTISENSTIINIETARPFLHHIAGKTNFYKTEFRIGRTCNKIAVKNNVTIANALKIGTNIPIQNVIAHKADIPTRGSVRG